MKKTLFILSLFISIPSFAQNESIRMMTYNIRNGRGVDEVTDFKRTASVINKINPDIIAIQEVDSVTGRSKGKYTLGEIAKYASMKPFFAPAISFDGGKYGIGILAKEMPLSYHYIALPGREERRAFLVVEMKDYVFCCVHLLLTPKDQLLSLPIIRGELAKYSKPVFFAGDLNASPKEKTIKDIEKDFTILNDKTMPTWPSDKPVKCLDYIITTKSNAAKLQVTHCEVINDGVTSDHRGVFIDIKGK